MRGFIPCIRSKYCSVDHIKKNEMGGACSTYGEKSGTCRVLVWGLRERDYLEDTGVDERIILKWIFRKWDGALTGLIWLKIGTGGGHL